MKRQLAALTDSTDESRPATRGFTPRAGKTDRRMKTTRFATKPLAVGGNWSQGTSKKLTVTPVRPFRAARIRCAQGKARHWYRDCPHGGRSGISAYSFTSEEAENSVLAARFQYVIDHDNAEEFDAPSACLRGW
ncbi:hypothetical protein CYMTET_27402 [Cymbomonas tetramitiformis]|uniref:Uncharacterized protein n=1 Tax=Cymbomonas tetramitiformis TaxID=36881 RepID=A0AAE0FQ30_9CHLO|nr:hypothetical protein CYMTET_27402 [Cymbomonas tetramitiformis]